MRRAGIPLIELLAVTGRAATIVDAATPFLSSIVVVDHHVTTSPGAIFHHGTVQSVSDTFEQLDLGDGVLEIPGYNRAIGFQLAYVRPPVGTGTLEPLPTTWRLDLLIDSLSVTVPGLNAAIYVPAVGTAPRHLVRDPSDQPVRLTGSAVVRFAGDADTTSVSPVIVDTPDPLDPLADNGFVAELRFSPPNFLFGDSGVGLTVNHVVFDRSTSYTPAAIVERGHGDAWVGVAIREATLYTPPGCPVVRNFSIGVRDLLIGTPGGIQGEIEAQWGLSPLDASTFLFHQAGHTDQLVVRGVDDAGGAAADPTTPSHVVELGSAGGTPVEVHVGLQTVAPPDDGGPVIDWEARFAWPDGTVDTGDRSSGLIAHGQTLSITTIEVIDIDGVPTPIDRAPAHTFTFEAQAERPRITAIAGDETIEEVIHLGGTETGLQQVQLTAIPAGPAPVGSSSEFTWAWRSHTHVGTSYALAPSSLRGDQTLTLSQRITSADGTTGEHVTRVIVTIVDDDAPDSDLLIGAVDGVRRPLTDPGNRVELSSVVSLFEAASFHSTGVRTSRPTGAVLTAASPFITVDPNTVAEVVVGTPEPRRIPRDRHIQVLFDFDTPNAGTEPTAGTRTWGAHRPSFVASGSSLPAFDVAHLRQWAAQFPDATFLVIGRCGDLGEAAYNAVLADQRAAAILTLLTHRDPGVVYEPRQEPIETSRVLHRGEQSDYPINVLATANALELLDQEWTETPGGPPVTAPLLGSAENHLATPRWLILSEEDPAGNGFPNGRSDARVEAIRMHYRRVDVYAVDAAPSPRWVPDIPGQTDGATEASAQRPRSFVEGPDGPMTPPPAGSSKADRRVRVRVAWDSPTAVTATDAIPTLLEFEYVWTPNEQPLGAISSGTGPDDLTEEIELSRETLTILMRLTYDHRTGQAKLATTVSSDGGDGLFESPGTLLPTAMALGPALLSHLDWNDDRVGSGARLTALVGLTLFAFARVTDPDSDEQRRVVSPDSKLIMRSMTVELAMDKVFNFAAGFGVRFLMDYTCELDIYTGSFLGLRTAPGKPMRVRYRDVGLEFDTDALNDPTVPDIQALGLVFDTAKMEIEDPGTWSMNGSLARLLRIVEVKVGVGSIWVELRIAVNLTIGIVEVSEAVVRVTWRDGDPVPQFELRGLVVDVDVPNAVAGQGRLELDDAGVIRAGIDATIIPAGLGASAALAFGEFRASDDAPATVGDVDTYHFLNLFVGVQFSTPLPLAQSGMAVYGFKGLFAMNGQRAINTSDPDPVGRELAWFAKAPAQKFEPTQGQWALGVGAVLGTMPDASFCFSCEGMLVVAFPDPAVVLGIKIHLVQVADTEVRDQTDSADAAITGLIVVDGEGVKVGALAQYHIPSVLIVSVPFAAFFPFADLNETYVRLGSDGQPGRPGQPISATLLPGTLDVTAYAFLMIEGAGLANLGGDPDFSFSGFSVGFGAGWSISWKAGPIELSASAEVLLGFGTNPLLLVGKVTVRGQLDLVVVSIAASGSLQLSVQEKSVRIDGEFCGEVDLFFFSLSGCVGLSIGTPPAAPAEPPSPLMGIDLTDRRDRIMGVATTGPLTEGPIVPLDGPAGGVNPAANNTVWPDTAPALHFAHWVRASVQSPQFSSLRNPPSQQVWTGSSELKYAFRLDDVVLRTSDGTVVAEDDITAVWMANPQRPLNSSGSVAATSEHEGPTLKLLHWDPFGWVVNLDRDEGSAGLPGDPVVQIEQICDELPMPALVCRYGHTARQTGLHAMRLPALPPFEAPYHSVFSVYGQAFDRVDGVIATGRNLQTAIAAEGASLSTGSVVDLPVAVTDHTGRIPIHRGYRLPMATFTYPDGLVTVHPPYELDFDREVATPSITLLVCDVPHQSTAAADDPAWSSGGPWAGENPIPGDGYDPDGPGWPGREGWPGWDGVPGWPGDDETKRCLTFETVDIGRSTHAATVRGVRLSSIDPAQEIRSVDRVDARGVASYGRDGVAEIGFPDDGLRIVLPRDCPTVTIHLASPRGGPIDAIAYSAPSASTGSRAKVAAVTTDETDPTTVTLHGGLRGVRSIEIFGGRGEAVVYEICCEKTAPPAVPDGCISFNRQGPLGDRVTKVREEGWLLVAVDPTDELVFVDAVDELVEPPRDGPDGFADIQFPDDGVRIIPPHDCTAITVHVMAFSRAPIVATAYDRAGDEVAVAKTDGTQREPFELHLAGDEPIAEVVVIGSSGEGVVYRVCCHDDAPRPSSCVDFRDARFDGKSELVSSTSGAVLRPRRPEDVLVLDDKVDDRGAAAVKGSDGVPELVVPPGGLVIELAEACDDLVIGFFAEGDATIALTVVQSDGTQLPPVTVKVTGGTGFPLGMPGDDVVTVLVEVREGGPLRVLELCCDDIGDPPSKPTPAPEPDPEPAPEPEPEIHSKDCVRFDDVGAATPSTAIEIGGMTVVASADGGLTAVKTEGGARGLAFAGPGAGVKLDGCDAVELTLLHDGQKLQVVAVDASGQAIDTVLTTGQDPETITLTGPGIAYVQIGGGGGVIVEICCLTLVGDKGRQRTHPAVVGDPDPRLRNPMSTTRHRRLRHVPGGGRTSPPDAATGPASLVGVGRPFTHAEPVLIDVIGERADGQHDSWQATASQVSTDRHGQRCRVITFHPPADHDGPWEGADIFARHGQVVTLLSVCGIDRSALDARDDDQDDREVLAATLTDKATSPGGGRRRLALDADTEYQIEVRWSWQAWQASDDDTHPPATTSSAAWVAAANPDVYRFKTAVATTSPPQTPDGLNEHIFDAADVGRYLIAVEPADGRSSHFLNDPIWVHFEVDHLEELLEIYGHHLDVQICRTDPPPQRSPGDLRDLLAPLDISVEWFQGAVQHLATATRALNDAVIASPCLPDGSPFGGASAAVTAELAPDADYDLTVTATGGIGGDRAVHRTRFHTSRYSTPEQLIAALGFGSAGASPPDELIVTAEHTVVGGPLDVGDMALDAALLGVDADTLPLPSTGCRTYLLWQHGTGGWLIVGVLIDCLETMHRQRTVIGTDGRAALGDRTVLDHLAIGGRRLDPVRANASWTRVLLVPPTPIAPDVDDDLDIAFRTESGTVTGSRTLSTRPQLLDREGLS